MLNEIRPGRPLDSVHPDYALLTPEQVRERSFQKLNDYVNRGAGRAATVVQSILNEVPRDRYVPTKAIKFHFDNAHGGIGVNIAGDTARGIEKHALDQTAERVGLNLRFLHTLLDNKKEWAGELAAHNLNELLVHTDNRFLVRQVDGNVRGVLSDSYKRIDSRPTVDALINAAEQSGAKVIDGIYTPTRVSLKVVKVEPIEVFKGEYMVFGLDYSNSDYGDGASEFSAFLLRLLCLNGAVAVKELRKVHLGRRYNGDFQLSEQTMRADARYQSLFAKDVVGKLLSNEATDHMVKQIQASNQEQIAPNTIEGFLKTRVSKGEAKEITEKFNSADVVELPAGQTPWRFSNAISWLAKTTDDSRRRMELERLAGEAMSA